MKKIFFFLLVTAIFVTGVLATSCSKTSSTDDDTEADDTTSSELASATSTVGEAVVFDSATRSSSLLGIINSMSVASSTSVACNTIAFSACDTITKTKTRAFSTDGGDTNPCTRGKSNGFNTYGKAILTFSADSCGTSANDTITRTLSNHYIRHGNAGKRILIYTGEGTVASKTIAEKDLKDYEGTLRSGGGVLTIVDSTSRKLSITGIHRRGLTTAGKYTFHHTIFTGPDAPLAITQSGDNRTVNGTVYIMHNRAKKKITKTMTNLVFDGSCRHPISGTVKLEIPDGSSSTEVTITYSSTCGSATIDGSSTDFEDDTK